MLDFLRARDFRERDFPGRLPVPFADLESRRRRFVDFFAAFRGLEDFLAATLLALRLRGFAFGKIVWPRAAALPAKAPTTPPTTAPTGPATLPIAAPVTAPAVCFGIPGIWISSDDCALSLFCASDSSAINCKAPSLLFGCHQKGIRTPSLSQPSGKGFPRN